MRLYLVRHGQAEGGKVDEKRPLNAFGRIEINAVARKLAAQGVRINTIYHSTLLRAEQTAGVMASQLKGNVSPQCLAGVEPWGDVFDFVVEANSWSADTMVCGHEPFMGHAVRALSGSIVMVVTGTVMVLERVENSSHWTLINTLTPGTV